jgi:hypothetical protein
MTQLTEKVLTELADAFDLFIPVVVLGIAKGIPELNCLFSIVVGNLLCMVLKVIEPDRNADREIESDLSIKGQSMDLQSAILAHSRLENDLVSSIFGSDLDDLIRDHEELA